MEGGTLRKRREELGHTQTALAALLDVDPMTISRWERGAVPVPRTVALLVGLLVKIKRGELVAVRGDR